MITVTLLKPESAYARQHAPVPGMACLQVVFKLANDNVTADQHWLQPEEVHCAFDPKWLYEHIQVLWKRLGEALSPEELLVVERCSPQRCAIERSLTVRPEEEEA